MKLWILSDVHLELEPDENSLSWIPGQPFPDDIDPDVVVLAGDVHRGAHAVHWAACTFPETPVIFVPGNHEYYRSDLFMTLNGIREAARGTSVTVLDNDTCVFGNVRFLGTTLWTDFLLYGQARRVLAMREAARSMADFRLIRVSQTAQFSPQASAQLHAVSRRWLTATLSQPFPGRTVVVTHHLPSLRSVHPRFEGQLINAAFASRLDALMSGVGAPELWIHGHTHASCDYIAGRTRVLCNPRGYLGWDANPSFKCDLVVEV